jgi:8-oxo-dGTP diphosphatase
MDTMAVNVEPNKIVVAVDTIILAIGESGLEVILIKIKSGPYENKWALPGGVVGVEESLDEAAKRIVTQKVSSNKLHLEQLYCFGDPKRDVRSRSVSVAYFALLSNKIELKTKLNELYTDIQWYPIDKLPNLAFDHREIIRVAKEKLAYKLDEIEMIRPLLPEKFTLSELRRVYEILSGKTIDKRNFVKKIKNEEMVVSANEIKTGVAHRPAKLFRFR